MQAQRHPEVEQRLDIQKHDKGGDPVYRPTIRNVRIILDHDPRLSRFVRYDQFRDKVEVGWPRELESVAEDCDVDPPTAWRLLTDQDAIDLHTWVDLVYDIRIPWRSVVEAIDVAARRHPYHPVRDWLSGLTWDQEPRLERWLVEGLGAADTSLTREIGLRWCLGAAARILDPGCKMDAALILLGAQGRGKSTALRVLCGAGWFSDVELDLHKQTEAALVLRGKWVHEFQEMSSLGRADANLVKSFLTRNEDSYRPPYGRTTITVPREMVFAGTSNRATFLQDETGNRRFLVVETNNVNIPWLERNREQLWAEAVHRYLNGDRWYLGQAEAKEHAEDVQRFVDDDPWHDVIARNLGGKKKTDVQSILLDVIGKQTREIEMRDQHRVGRILSALGYRKRRARGGGGKFVTSWELVQEVAA